MTAILYHCIGARSFRPLWALEELRLPYELRILSFPPRLTQPAYLADNPLGTVPLFIDGEVRMRESTMIGHLLATRAGSDLAVAPDEPGYPRYLDALAYGEATLSWPQGVILLYGTFLPDTEQLPAVVERMKTHLQKVIGDLATMLGDAEFIAADRFTMADISIGYALQLAQYVVGEEPLPQRLKAYFERLAERPAYARASARKGD